MYLFVCVCCVCICVVNVLVAPLVCRDARLRFLLPTSSLHLGVMVAGQRGSAHYLWPDPTFFMTGVSLCRARIAWLGRGGWGRWNVMHALEVVVPCQGLISGLLMMPGGSGLMGMEGGAEVSGPRTLYFQGLEGCAELRSYPGAREFKLWYSVCLQWPNICLISLRARLFTHHPPFFSQLSHRSVYPLGSQSVLLVKPRLPAALNPSLLSPRPPDIPTPSASGTLIYSISCILQVICLAPHVYTCRLKYTERAPQGERHM